LFDEEGFDRIRANEPVTKLELYVLMRLVHSSAFMSALEYTATGEQKERVKAEAERSTRLFEDMMLGLISNKGKKVVDRSDEQ